MIAPAKAVVDSCARPVPSSGALPIRAPLSLKMIVPVGVPPAPVTLPTNVIGVPTFPGLGEAESVVVLPFGLMACVSAGDVLLAKVGLPP